MVYPAPDMSQRWVEYRMTLEKRFSLRRNPPQPAEYASMRVIFDTNALSNESFDQLEASPMRDLVRRGRIKPVYGHVFIEETMRELRVRSQHCSLKANSRVNPRRRQRCHS